MSAYGARGFLWVISLGLFQLAWGQNGRVTRNGVASPEEFPEASQPDPQKLLLSGEFRHHLWNFNLLSPLVVSSAVVLRMGWFCPPGDIWQLLETLLIVKTGEILLASSEQKPGMLFNMLQDSSPPPRNIQPLMPVLARLGNLHLDDLIRSQSERTEKMTDGDSEKAVLCPLNRQTPQYGRRELIRKLEGSWRVGYPRPLTLSPPSSAFPSASC